MKDSGDSYERRVDRIHKHRQYSGATGKKWASPWSQFQQTGTVAQLVLQKMDTHGWQVGDVETLRIVDAVLTGK
jgi:hypothetical protein